MIYSLSIAIVSKCSSKLTGTQTLKGYPMFQQHASSSDKEMVDDVPGRKRDLRDRMPLRSRENHPPNKTPTRHLRDRTEHDRQNNRELRGRSDRDLKERPEPEKDISEQTRPANEEKDTRHVVDETFMLYLMEFNIIKIKLFFRTRKSDSPSRFREGPVTRLCGSIEKNEKPKAEQDEADEDSLRESEKPDNNDNSENEDVSKLV